MAPRGRHERRARPDRARVGSASPTRPTSGRGRARAPRPARGASSSPRCRRTGSKARGPTKRAAHRPDLTAVTGPTAAPTGARSRPSRQSPVRPSICSRIRSRWPACACGLLDHVHEDPPQRDVAPHIRPRRRSSRRGRARHPRSLGIARTRRGTRRRPSRPSRSARSRKDPWSSQAGSTGSPANVSANQPTSADAKCATTPSGERPVGVITRAASSRARPCTLCSTTALFQSKNPERSVRSSASSAEVIGRGHLASSDPRQAERR